MSQPKDDFDGRALAIIVAFASTRSSQFARHRLTIDANATEPKAKRGSRGGRNRRKATR